MGQNTIIVPRNVTASLTRKKRIIGARILDPNRRIKNNLGLVWRLLAPHFGGRFLQFKLSRHVLVLPIVLSFFLSFHGPWFRV